MHVLRHQRQRHVFDSDLRRHLVATVAQHVESDTHTELARLEHISHAVAAECLNLRLDQSERGCCLGDHYAAGNSNSARFLRPSGWTRASTRRAASTLKSETGARPARSSV